MGDIADYQIECIEEAMADEAREVMGWLKAGEDKLRAEVIERGYYRSAYTKLVRSIIQSPNALSKKQRKCLALYLVKDNRI